MIILQANCNHPRWQIRTQIAEASSWLPWKRRTRPSQPSGRHAYNSCLGMDVSHGLMKDMRKRKKTKKDQQEEYPQPPQIAIVCIIGRRNQRSNSRGRTRWVRGSKRAYQCQPGFTYSSLPYR